MTWKALITLFSVALAIGCSGEDDQSGDSWTEEAISSEATQVLAVWASAADDVWAADINGLFHFDGTAWSSVEERDGSFRTIRDFWGLAADDLYAVNGSRLFHWDGAMWTYELLTELTTGESLGLNAVWASSATDIWVGDTLDDDLWHYDGSWTHHPLGMGYILDLWGSGPNDVWVVTELSVSHWDGSDWTLQMPRGLSDPRGVWGTSTSDVWIVGYESFAMWDGTGFSVMTVPPEGNEGPIRATWGNSRSDLWAVGSNGFVSHWDGSIWTAEHRDEDSYFSAIHGTSGAGTWIGGRREMLPSPSAGIVLHRAP